MKRDEEIEAFKTRINLSLYATSIGYTKVRRKSSPNCCVMKQNSGDVIIIGRGADHHWIYYTVGNDGDNGSIVDFVQNRKGGSIGDVRKELRPWLAYEAMPITSYPAKEHEFSYSVQATTKDISKVQASFLSMTQIDGRHSYLEEGRGLGASLLSSPRFDGRIFVDERNNAVFPHRNSSGICGYEIKNRGFTGFSKGGEKGLWYSNFEHEDETLVIAETAIDALSYAQLKGSSHTRFFSIGGSMNEIQPRLLISAVQKMPQKCQVILAMDNDEGGDRLAEQIQGLLSQINAAGCVLAIDRPQTRGQDWNDALRASLAENLKRGLATHLEPPSV